MTMSTAALAFKIVYNALYYLFYLVLLVLLVVTPADLIRQALDFRQIWIVLVIALCYLVAIIVVALIYAIRLYVSRSAVAAIPKQWIPLDKGDMPREVRAMVAEGLSRSAAIAYAARPRIPPFGEGLPDAEGGEPNALGPEPTGHTLSRHKSKKNNKDEGMVAVTLPQYRPPWGEIEHPGWASPLSPDLTNLQYHSIMLELPNLIEAKALTLAPQDAESQADRPMLDPEAVELLQRADHMDLRGYLAHLTELGVLESMNGICTELQHVFLATGLEHVGDDAQAADGITAVTLVPFAEVLDLVRSGRITDGQTVSSLLLAQLQR